VAITGILVTQALAAPIASGTQLNAALAYGTFTAGTPFSSGQYIEVNVPANSALSPTGLVKIIECSDPGGLPANLPTTVSGCDTTTIQGDSLVPNADGSFDYYPGDVNGDAGYEVISLPSRGPSSITCNLTNACVLWIGDNYNNLLSNQLWSDPFYVAPNTGNTGVNPGDGSAPTVATTPSATLSTVSASSTTAVADGVDPRTVTVTLNGQNAQSATVPIAGAPVTLSQGSAHSIIAPTSTATTNSSGVATFTVTDSTPEAVTYTATSGAVVVDQTAMVTFAAPTVSAANSTVSTSPPSVPADGSTTSTVTVTAYDQAAGPAPVSGQTVTLTQGAGHSVISPTSATTNSSGVATFTVTDLTVEPVTYTATIGTVTVTQTGSVTFGTLTVSPTTSTVRPASPTALTGGTEGTTVTVTLKTAGGTAVSGKAVTLAGVGGSGGSPLAGPPSVTTDVNGQAQFNVTDTTVESAIFTATDTTDGVVISNTATVAFSAPPPPTPSPTLSTVNISPTTLVADGTATANIAVTIKDSAGNPLPNKQVVVAPTSPDTKLLITGLIPDGGTVRGVTDSNGLASFTAVDTLAETVTLTVTDTTDNMRLETQAPLKVTFTPGPVDASQSSVSVSPAAVPADGSTHATVTVTLDDHFGNPVSGKSVSLNQGTGHSVITPSTAVSATNGVATFAVTDTANENVTYTATDTTDGLVLPETVQVAFGSPPPVPPDPFASAIVSNYSSVPADGTTAATITVLLYNSVGLPVSGRTVVVTALGGSSTVTPVSPVTGSSGSATFKVTDRTPESVTYSATDTSDSVKVAGSVSIKFTTATVSPSSSALNAPIVGVAATVDGHGYWSVASDGGIFAFGDAGFHGSMGATHLNQPIVGMAATTDGLGYWMVAADGGIFAFGDAGFHGSMGGVPLDQPIVGMAATPDGKGYWLVAADGGIFAFGDAGFHGSMGGVPLNRPIVGMAATTDGLGYWMVASDGGIFAFGDAGFYGSLGSLQLNQPIVGMAATPDGKGYWLGAADGGIFNAGDAGFYGSLGSLHLNAPIVGIATTPDGKGYWLAAADGGMFNAGDAAFYGSAA
jgi:hypothetical protein